MRPQMVSDFLSDSRDTLRNRSDLGLSYYLDVNERRSHAVDVDKPDEMLATNTMASLEVGCGSRGCSTW